MSMRAFDPWVGDHYRSSGYDGLRILILGESQYDSVSSQSDGWTGAPTPECKASTQEIVRELALGPGNSFFTKITKLVLNRPSGVQVAASERIAFWHGVAFYNYIQWWLRAARYRPTPEMWDTSREPFLQVLGELQPHVLLVLGKELGNHLPSFPEASAIRIAHPSSKGFSYVPWIDQIASALEMRKGASQCARNDHPSLMN